MAKTNLQKAAELFEKTSLEDLQLMHNDLSSTILKKVKEREDELSKETEKLNDLKNQIKK